MSGGHLRQPVALRHHAHGTCIVARPSTHGAGRGAVGRLVTAIIAGRVGKRLLARRVLLVLLWMEHHVLREKDLVGALGQRR